jgi:hypothetical protein
MLLQRLQGFEAIACFGTDNKFRPQLVQGFPKLRSEQWFVFGNDGGGQVHAFDAPAVTSI